MVECGVKDGHIGDVVECGVTGGHISVMWMNVG